jgi:environmental stress-induced protein Ves
MITIIPPSHFKTIPWKNGLGETTELAINEKGSLDSFDWRLSIASVVNDGLFSDFSGYQRQLILIEGNGINLQHDNEKIDQLDQLLKIANFDGGCKTIGTLHSGKIKDFNVMTNQQTYTAIVKTVTKSQSFNITTKNICFVYSHNNNFLYHDNNQQKTISNHHLLKINSKNKEATFQLRGENFIFIEFTKNNTLYFNRA